MRKELSITRAKRGWEMKANPKGQTSAILIFLSLVLPLSVLAITIPNPLTATTFGQLIENVITFIFNIALAIVPLMIVIAGFYFVTAAGDPAKVKTAKDIILYTLIGFLIILLAKGFIAFLKEIL